MTNLRMLNEHPKNASQPQVTSSRLLNKRFGEISEEIIDSSIVINEIIGFGLYTRENCLGKLRI